MKVKAIVVLFSVIFLYRCNNLGLLDKLENPGGISSGASGGEKFTANNYVFVSSWTTLGDMANNPYAADCNGNTGANRADCACSRAAAMRGLRKSSTHVFRAWLSVDATPGPSKDAQCRVQGIGNGCGINFPVTWYNTLGQAIVNDYNGFSSGALLAAIRHDEFGVDQGANLVWTGTLNTGLTATGNDCSDWTDATGGVPGSIGDRTLATTLWTQTSPTPTAHQLCNTAQRIYCVAAP